MSRDRPDDLAGVRQGYDRWASSYDVSRNALVALEGAYLRVAIGEVRGLEVLDLGCGTGRHTMWLAEAGGSVTGLDFSEGMLDEARRKLDGRARFVQHDLLEPLPFADHTFDVVVSGLVLEHLDDLQAFFGEVYRTTRRGGRAVLSAMHPAMFRRGGQAGFTDLASNESVQPGSLDHQLEDIIAAIRAAGFQIDAIGEHPPNAELVRKFPHAQKYLDCPMLLVLQLTVPP